MTGRDEGDDRLRARVAALQGQAGLPVAPVGQIHPQAWMTAPETRAVLDALLAGGSEVRFVGGCVRDAVVKRPVNDVDIALALPPDQAMALLQAAGIRVVPTGIDHGTVTAVVGGKPFEITTLRVDVETFGRHARVAFTDDWVADAARRDFTMNALSCTPDGRIYDYFDGLDDLGCGRVRFVGDPNQRIAEDVLRLLRFFRFYAHYGKPPPDADALAACRAWADKIPRLSGERVRVELLRTLAAADPADVFQLMRDAGVLAHVLPEARAIDRLRMLSWLETRAINRAGIGPDPLRRLAALLPSQDIDVAALAERLKLSNDQRARLAAMVLRPMQVDADADDGTISRALHRLGPGMVRDLVLLGWADERALTPRLPPARTARWLALLDAVDAWQPIEFPLKGRDALALGLSPGPRLGELLRQVEAWWEDGSYRADRQACLDQLMVLAAAGR